MFLGSSLGSRARDPRSTSTSEGTISTATPTLKRPKITLRSPELRDLARRIASLGHRRVRQGHPLNVRRRESLRRAFIEAGETLGWGDVAAVGSAPLKTVRNDVRKMVRSGVKSLQRTVESELAAKEEEEKHIESVVETLQEWAEDPKGAEFPMEISFDRTAKSGSDGFKVKTEVLSLEGAEDAAKAAKKLEKSMPRWGRIREKAIIQLQDRQDTLSQVGRNLTDVLDGWRGLMKEVLVVMN